MFPLDQFVQHGHCVVQLPRETVDSWRECADGIQTVPLDVRRGFSFYDRTDGFIEHGIEYSAVPSRPDLCDRYCYWYANQIEHRAHAFHRHPFYAMVQRFEESVHQLADSINRAVRAHFGQPAHEGLREDSYVQICAYNATALRAGREYLQDPHEDGHLFTIAKPTSPGLVVLEKGRKRPVVLEADQAFVMAGSMLAALTDEAIRPVVHAVDAASSVEKRASILYFANPSVTYDTMSWRAQRTVDIAALMQERHTAFGNAKLDL